MDTKNKIDNKFLIPTIISVLFLVVLIISASYAYFAVTEGDSSSSAKLQGSVEDIGSVSFEKTNNVLTMNLDNMQMIQLNKDVTYYASNTGITTEPTSEVLGFLKATGNGNFSCNYELEIKATSTTADTNLYTKFQGMTGKSTDQIVLTITSSSGTKTYDFNTPNLFPITHSGSVSNLSEGTVENISAQLKFVNKTGVVQDALQNGNITFTMSVKTFKCDIVG